MAKGTKKEKGAGRKKQANKILNEVLSEIKPKKEKLEEADSFLKKLGRSIKRSRIDAKAVAGGSFAKGTFLKGDHDVDVFVKFSMKYRDESLSRLLYRILRQFRPETVHGSRDYYRIRNRLNFEIVPVLDIKKPEDAQNVTDFSPEHVRWVQKKGKKYRDGIRLAKKFCKANGVYGAESYINGFSGHVLDILVIHYKGFLPMLKAATKWKKKQVIDFYNKYKGKALFELNKSKTQSSLIVIDPVQPGRNAAAALADEKFNAFVDAAKKFLESPSKDFFMEKKADIGKLKSKGAIIVEAEPKKGKEDVAGAKLRKAFDFLKKGLADFGIKDAGWEWDRKKRALFWVVPKLKKLPKEMEWEGPPLEMENRVAEFRKKHKKTFKKKGRTYAKVKRKHTTPEALAKVLTKKRYFAEKVKKCTIL